MIPVWVLALTLAAFGVGLITGVKLCAGWFARALRRRMEAGSLTGREVDEILVELKRA